MPEPTSDKPCARCKEAPRNSNHRSYCVECLKAHKREDNLRQKTSSRLDKPCARCKVAPRNSSLKSYCIECKNALHRESMKRLGGKKPQEFCSRCGDVRGISRHASYCVECLKEYRQERLAGPCSKCGKLRQSGDKMNDTYCYDCCRDWWLMRNYGITSIQYEQMLVNQDNRCGICREETNGRTWHVDHDHKTGDVRGLLCDTCNRGIGSLRDDPALLRRAAEYLEQQQ